jgi:SAM-dependent methyltransferase
MNQERVRRSHMTQPNQSQSEYWCDQGARFWISFRPQFAKMMAPLVQPTLDAIEAQPGEYLLDIGCGYGEETLELARRVGPHGHVTGIDISTPMVELGRDLARAAGLANVRFADADAQTHPFPRQVYDGLFSCFGVMFFDDPIAAFRNLARSLKRGGRIAFACWRGREVNEWWKLPTEAALRQVPGWHLAPPSPTGAYSLASAARIRALLSGAGLEDVRVEPLDAFTGGIDLDSALAYVSAGPLGGLLQANPQAASAAKTAVRAMLREHDGPNGVFLRSAIWIVTAHKS